MALTPYQIIVPLISVIAVIYAWNLFLRQKKTLWEVCLWTLFWGGISLIAIYPSAIDYFSRFTGIKDRENAVFITCIGVLSFAVFYVVMRLEELEQRQTKLIRKMALKDADIDEEENVRSLAH